MIGGPEFLLILLVGVAFFGFGIVVGILKRRKKTASKAEEKPVEEKKDDAEASS